MMKEKDKLSYGIMGAKLFSPVKLEFILTVNHLKRIASTRNWLKVLNNGFYAVAYTPHTFPDSCF